MFESRRGQRLFYAIILITICTEKNVKPALKGAEIMKQLVKINEKCFGVEAKGVGGWKRWGVKTSVSIRLREAVRAWRVIRIMHHQEPYPQIWGGSA